MPQKRNPLNLNPLQLKTLTLLQELARLAGKPTTAEDDEPGGIAITEFPHPHGDHFHLGEALVAARDETGLRNRHQIGVDTITWECDYPHSDSTWPTSPETLMKSLEATQIPDDEIDMVTWQNACRWYQFDPLAHRPREECTVGALRAQALDVDTTPREYGGFHVGDHLTLDSGNATRFLERNNAASPTNDA